MSAIDTALEEVRTFTVNKASITKVIIFQTPPLPFIRIHQNSNGLEGRLIVERMKLHPQYTERFQVTVFLSSLTDGSSTGVTDGESVEGSVFVKRISVRANLKQTERDKIWNFDVN